MLDTTISFQHIWRFLKERSRLIIISAIIFTGLYLYIVQYYGQSFGLFYYQKVTFDIPVLNPKPEYNIYSGGHGGIYYPIAEIISGIDSKKALAFLKANNHISSGGYENVLKVLGDPEGKAFGLVQEEAYNKHDMIRKELNYITPLYLERIHVIYAKNNHTSVDYRISSNTDTSTLRFLADPNKTIYIGSPSSGTHIISRYIIDDLNEQIAQYNKSEAGRSNPINSIKNLTNKRSKHYFDRLTNKDPNIIFISISGAPTKSIFDLLVKKDTSTNELIQNYGMVSIEPDFTSDLNNKYDINLNFTTFKSKYPGYDHVTTFGTFAWLITNKKTPPADIKELLGALKKNKNSLLKRFSIPTVYYYNDPTTRPDTNSTKIQSPLDEFDFLGHYKNKNAHHINNVWRNIILFLITLIPSTILLFHLLTGLISISKTDRFHDLLVEIMDNNIPKNALPSLFGFAKLNEEYDYKELAKKEYNQLKQKTITILFREIEKVQALKIEAERIQNNKRLKSSLLKEHQEARYRLKSIIKKLKHKEIAKLIAILISNSIQKVNWKNSNIDPIENILKDFPSIKKSEIENDLTLAELIFNKTKVPKFRLNPKIKVIALFEQVLNYKPNINYLKENGWTTKEEVNKSSSGFILPFIKEDQLSIVNRIIKGISKLFDLRAKISEDYTNGLLTEKNYNFLYSKIESILLTMQSSLANRLNELIEREDLSIDKELLLSYFTADYLNRESYHFLKVKLGVSKLNK